jgi:hypothetical protein
MVSTDSFASLDRDWTLVCPFTRQRLNRNMSREMRVVGMADGAQALVRAKGILEPLARQV